MRKFVPLLLFLIASCAQDGKSDSDSAILEFTGTSNGLSQQPAEESSDVIRSPQYTALEDLDRNCDTSIFAEDPPAGFAQTEKKNLKVQEMRLRPVHAENILVPGSWVVDSSKSWCKRMSDSEEGGYEKTMPLHLSKVWVNPVNENEAVYYRTSGLNEETAPPFFDATSDIMSLLRDHHANYQNELIALGSNLIIHEARECLFEFHVDDENYRIDGVWFSSSGNSFVVSFIIREKFTDYSDLIEDDFISSVVRAHSYQLPDLTSIDTPPIDYCSAMSNINFDWTTAFPPVGGATYNRPEEIDPTNMLVNPACLSSGEINFSDPVKLSDGRWIGEAPDGDEDVSKVTLLRLAYADLILEGELASGELELIIGLLCEKNGFKSPEVHAFKVISGELTQIGDPIRGYLANVFDSGENIYHAGSGGGGAFYYPERFLVVNPDALFLDTSKTGHGDVCCESSQYETIYYWGENGWSSEDNTKELEEIENVALGSLYRLTPAEDCFFREYTGYVPAQYQKSGVNVSFACEFTPTGSNINLDVDVEYVLTVSAGEESMIDEHVRVQIREILDWWIKRFVERVLDSGGYILGPESMSESGYLDINADVSFQNNRFYSVKIFFDYFMPWWFNPDRAVETVIVDKKSGKRLLVDDIFDSSKNWKSEVSKLIEDAALLKYPRCSLNYPSEKFDPFSFLDIGIRFYLYLSPNACGLGSVDIDFERLNRYLNTELLDNEE